MDSRGNPLLDPGVSLPCDHEAILACIQEICPLYHPAVMYRRKLVTDLGGYRDAHSSAEDYDLWLRLALRSKLANLPEKLITYRVHSGQISHQHLVSQSRRCAIAWLAHREREHGRTDPTEGLARLPFDREIQGLFGAGSMNYVNARIAHHVVAALPSMTRGEWRRLIARQLDYRGRANLWRAIVRLAYSDGPRAALRVAFALLIPKRPLKDPVPKA